MTTVGRGRARGGRIIDVDKIKTILENRKNNAGRGMTLATPEELEYTAGRDFAIPAQETKPMAGRRFTVSSTEDSKPMAGRGFTLPSNEDSKPMARQGLTLPSTEDSKPITGRGFTVPSPEDSKPIADHKFPVAQTEVSKPMTGRKFHVDSTRATKPLANRSSTQDPKEYYPMMGRGLPVPPIKERRVPCGRGFAFEPEPVKTTMAVREVGFNPYDASSSSEDTEIFFRPHRPHSTNDHDPTTLKHISSESSSEQEVSEVLNDRKEIFQKFIHKQAAAGVLNRELDEFVKTGEGCLIHITLKYFARSDEVDFYLASVFYFILRSPEAIDRFSRCIKLLTLIKKYGDEIKSKLFTKLQSLYEDIQLVEDWSDTKQQNHVRSFTDLIGQLYYRFRPFFHRPEERYQVLAKPTAMCLKFLLAFGEEELFVLNKQIALNKIALHDQLEEIMIDLQIKAREALASVDGARDGDVGIMLMSAIDLMNAEDGLLPLHLANFYMQHLGSEWMDVYSTHRRARLEPVPKDLTEPEKDLFDADLLEEYKKYKLPEMSI